MSNQQEIWKPVHVRPFSEIYEVSNLGRLKRKARTIHQKSKTGEMCYRNLKEVIFKTSPSFLNGKPSYSTVRLSHLNKKFTIRIHQLVCIAFKGFPKDGQCVRHLNGNPHDNRAENLAWGTVQENSQDKKLHGTQTFGDLHPCSKLSDLKAKAIYQMAWSGLSLEEVGEIFNVPSTTVSGIKHQRVWKRATEDIYLVRCAKSEVLKQRVAA